MNNTVQLLLLEACRQGDIDMVMEHAEKMTDFDFSEVQIKITIEIFIVCA